MEEQNRVNTIPDDVFYNNVDYFKNLQSKHANETVFASWNWPAFFFGPVWFIYRRCYLGALAVYFFQYFVSLILSSVTYAMEEIWMVLLVSTIISLIPAVLIGIFGNSFYFYFMRNKIEKLLHSGVEIPLIAEKCRPSWTPVWIYYAIAFGWTVVLAVFLLGSILLLGLMATAFA